MIPYVETQRRMTHPEQLEDKLRSCQAEVERDHGAKMYLLGVRQEELQDAAGRRVINVYAQYSRVKPLAKDTHPLNPRNLNDSEDVPMGLVDIEHPRDRAFGTGGEDNVIDPALGGLLDDATTFPVQAPTTDTSQRGAIPVPQPETTNEQRTE